MTHILGILCAPTAEKSVAYGLLRKALRAAEEAGTSSELEILRPDFSIKAVQKKLLDADGLIIATPVHWFNMSVLAKRLIDEVFWDFDNEDYELEGVPLGIIATCNEDGANQAIASIAMPLNHCGLYVPPFGTLIHNIAMPGHGERGWQNEPEAIGRQVAEYALDT
jgi:multimeric flavodoxin WrbA